MIPAFAKWFSLKSGTDVEDDELMAVDEQLEQVTDYVFQVINNSNFNQESHEAFLDLAIGTACLLVTEGDETQPIKFNAVPLPQMLLLSGPDGKIDWIFRLRNINYGHNVNYIVNDTVKYENNNIDNNYSSITNTISQSKTR